MDTTVGGQAYHDVPMTQLFIVSFVHQLMKKS
jgi:hypothetical protein